ncbi:MAG: Bax inhibitor-1/YccA family protein [Polyangiales bacterium]
MNSSPFAPPVAGPLALDRDTVGFLRKVYLLFFAGIVSATGGALTALYAGTASSQLVLDRVGPLQGVHVPPLVAWFGEHWILAMLLYFGAFFGMSAVRRRPGINVVALVGFTFLSGLYIAPMLFIAGVLGTSGAAMTANPVRDAFLLTVAAFGGLTAYVLVTKRDFSFLRGFLSMGLLVLIVAMLIGMFVGSSVFHLAIASVGVLLFGAYVLYDTSRLMRTGDRTDPVGAAVSLYLDFLNLFLFILRILMSSRQRS